MSRIVNFSSPAMPLLMGEPALGFSHIEGKESLSELYTYTLTAKTPANPAIPWQTAANLNLKDFIGKEFTIEIKLDGEDEMAGGMPAKTREISGLVEKARFIGRDGYRARYELVIRPWLYLTDLTSDYKIFQQKSAIDIIDEVLSEYPFPYEKRLSGFYPLLDYQVQYGETDFNFVQRLMEEWGIYWFYEHADHKHRLVLVDHVGAHKRYPNSNYHQLRYHTENNGSQKEYINQFTLQERITPGKWVTNDYDFTKSRADIMALDLKPRKTSFNEMEIFNWPGDYDDPIIGEQLARIRMEERGGKGSRSQGEAKVRAIVCGTTFTLQDHPVAKANREYLVLSSKLLIKEDGQVSNFNEENNPEIWDFNCEFTVQPTTKIYRHPQTAMKPKTRGPQTALVVGPMGQRIWTDEYGRVKVRFLWDRYGQNRETDSCWVRVSQAWAGDNFGGIYIPRIGQEVIVDFLNGDPDRPLIMGSLYNNVTMPPWQLPLNATQSGMISRTIDGGVDNYNGVRFEDKPGLEQYWEQAERNMSRLIKNDETHTIGLNSHLTVGANRNVKVAANYTKDVVGDATKSIGGNYVKGILGALTESVSMGVTSGIGMFRHVTVGAADVLNVGGAHALNVGGASAINVKGAHALNVGGASVTNVGGISAVNVGGAYSVYSGGAASMVAENAAAICSGGELCLTADIIRIVAGSQVIIQAPQIHLNPGDNCDKKKGCCGNNDGDAFCVAPVGAPIVALPACPVGVLPPLPPMPLAGAIGAIGAIGAVGAIGAGAINVVGAAVGSISGSASLIIPKFSFPIKIPVPIKVPVPIPIPIPLPPIVIPEPPPITLPPGETPEQTPGETPEQTPGETPEQTPGETP
ncbi:type VI secretion system Vgr family protein, partial [Pantoea sp.]|uniref:type VI secretion system Vgr family protein n=1 Tax=Pantoea sp. TaxID=69393 RepID=UPI0039184F07